MWFLTDSSAAITKNAGRAIFLALFAAGCGREAVAPAALRIAVHTDPLSLDPHAYNEVLTYSILTNLYDGLTAFDSDLRIVPSLAARWENPDDHTWRFYLNPEARFHDGRPVEAQDVVFSLLRARTEPHSGNASYLVEVETVRALDRGVVELKTRRPFGGLLNKLAFVFVVPRDAPEQIAVPLGSGPYRFVSYRPGQALRLAPVGRDWRKRTARHPLEFRPISDAAERVARLIDGTVDIAQDLLPSQADRLKSVSSCRAVVLPSLMVEYLHLRVGDPRFRDPRVREAIDLALDRAALLRNTRAGYGAAASQMVSPGVFGFDPDIPIRRRDLTRARRLLQEAGFPRGFAVTLEARLGRNGDQLVRQLGELGLQVSSKVSAWAELYERLKRWEVDFYYGGVVSPTADASDLFDGFVHSRDIPEGYGLTNFNGYSSSELDQTIAEIAAMRDMLQRRGLMQKAMRMLVDDRYLIPLTVPSDIYGIRQDIEWSPHVNRMLVGQEMRRLDR